MARRRRRSGLRKAIDWGTMVLLLGGLAAFVAWLEIRNPLVLEGRVQVVDGDSLVVDGEKVRLRGIDAPEFDQICQRNGEDWNCGRRSRDALRQLVRRGKVVCKGGAVDQYDRWLARCEVGGVEINRELVEKGWAIDFGGYADAERRARSEGRGIWEGTFERPQEWRRAQRGDMASHGDQDGFFVSLWANLKGLFRRVFS